MTIAVDRVELPDGRVIDDYWRVELFDHVVIVATTPDGSLICERQYKHGAGRVGLTLPAGHIDGDEPPLLAAQRELLEETGHGGGEWKSLGDCVVSATQYASRAYFFQATDVVFRQPPASGDLEEMQILLLSPAAVSAAIRGGEFIVAGDLAALLLARE
jgi:ADP-ribose pyrophosphatase